jgi:hypothetical protein
MLVARALFLLSLAIGIAMKRELFAAYAGFALWLPAMLLVLPFMSHWYFVLLDHLPPRQCGSILKLQFEQQPRK